MHNSLSACLPSYLSMHLSVCRSANLSVCLFQSGIQSGWMTEWLSVSRSVNQSFSHSACQSVSQTDSQAVIQSDSQSVSQSVNLFVCLPACLSIPYLVTYFLPQAHSSVKQNLKHLGGRACFPHPHHLLLLLCCRTCSRRQLVPTDWTHAGHHSDAGQPLRTVRCRWSTAFCLSAWPERSAASAGRWSVFSDHWILAPGQLAVRPRDDQCQQEMAN